MKISDLLEESTVELNLKVKRKEEAIRELVSILYKANKIKNPEEIVATLLEREKSAPTALVNGVALPHATVEGLQEAVAGLIVLKSGISFGAPDKRPVRIIFLFLSPAEEIETHLQILSKAEGLLHNKKLLSSFLSTGSKQKLIGEIINAVEALRELIPSYGSVLRDRQEKRILTSEIVPGDVILLKEGDKVPADGRLFEAFDMRVDNSPLTGESRPIYKIAEPVLDGRHFLWTEMPNLIFGGTSVISGEGKAMIIATGMHSEIGKIARFTQAIKEEPSPLQKEMAKVTKVVSVLAVSMGVLFFFPGSYVAQLTTFESFIFAIGIIVANVPEGLLPTVSLALAMAVQRMAKRHVIVKRLSSVETLGCTTVICTDKTGTLTTNQVSVVKLWLNNRLYEITDSGYDPGGEIFCDGFPLSPERIKSLGMEELIKIGVLCNNAEVLAPANGKPLRS